jgi:hypothetical protein
MKGWYNQSYRHSLAAKGIRTSFALNKFQQRGLDIFYKILEKNPSLKEKSLSDIRSNASMHVFDDHPEEFGLTDEEANKLRSFLQHEVKDPEVLEKVKLRLIESKSLAAKRPKQIDLKKSGEDKSKKIPFSRKVFKFFKRGAKEMVRVPETQEERYKRLLKEKQLREKMQQLKEQEWRGAFSIDKFLRGN